MRVSTKLIRSGDGYAHWCPACRELHAFATESVARPNWTFDGDVERPTFQPSMRVTWGRHAVAGWVDPDGETEAMSGTCHYHLTDGAITYCADSTHSMAGLMVDLPDLPPERG